MNNISLYLFSRYDCARQNVFSQNFIDQSDQRWLSLCINRSIKKGSFLKTKLSASIVKPATAMTLPSSLISPIGRLTLLSISLKVTVGPTSGNSSWQRRGSILRIQWQQSAGAGENADIHTAVSLISHHILEETKHVEKWRKTCKEMRLLIPLLSPCIWALINLRHDTSDLFLKNNKKSRTTKKTPKKH